MWRKTWFRFLFFLVCLPVAAFVAVAVAHAFYYLLGQWAGGVLLLVGVAAYFAVGSDPDRCTYEPRKKA